MTEEAVFVTMDLPEAMHDAEFFADLNVVGVRRGLSCAEREAALDDMQARWRRQHMHLVGRAS